MKLQTEFIVNEMLGESFDLEISKDNADAFSKKLSDGKVEFVMDKGDPASKTIKIKFRNKDVKDKAASILST